MERVLINPVYTAHPTEAIRLAILAKEQRLASALIDRMERPQQTQAEEAMTLAALDEEIRTTWQTEEHLDTKAVADEVEHIVFYLVNVIYDVCRGCTLPFRIRSGSGSVMMRDAGLLLAGLRRPHRESGDADDPVLLAEEVEGLGGLFGEADDAFRVLHGTDHHARRRKEWVAMPSSCVLSPWVSATGCRRS